MRLQTNNSKSSQSLYVVKTVYFNKKKTNKVVEKLGTYDELKKNQMKNILATKLLQLLKK